MMGFQQRKQMAEMRRILQNSKRRITIIPAVGSKLAPDNASVMGGMSQISRILDVRAADGTITFVLGVTGMTDGLAVE